nr:probable choline kinase 2 [Tanacetum cinerariifolium]
MSSSSSDENKKMKSIIGDDDEIKATREKLMLDFHKDVEASFGDKLRSVTYWGSLQMRRVADDKACRCRVQPKTLAVAVSSEEERALEVVAVARLLNFFVEALCKVRREIDVEFSDEANAADPYKELGRLHLTLSQRRSPVHRTGSKASLSSSLAVYRNRASASIEGLGGSLVMDSAVKVDAIGSCLPTEAKKMLHSLASSWDDIVDVDALQLLFHRLSSSLAVYRNRASASTEGLGGSLVMDSAVKVDAIGSCLPTEATKILHSLASSWDDIVDVDALQVIRLKGAMTNEVYQIKWPTNRERSRKVLVRIYGEGVGVFFDRELEIKTFEFMSKQGQGPRLLGRFSNGRIEEFIRARGNDTTSKSRVLSSNTSGKKT